MKEFGILKHETKKLRKNGQKNKKQKWKNWMKEIEKEKQDTKKKELNK